MDNSATKEVAEELKGVLKKIGDGVEEQKKLFGSEIETIKTQIKDLAERSKKRSSATIPGLEDERENFSFHYALRYSAYGEKGLPAKSDAGYELAQSTKAILDETTQKALDSGVDTLGGYVVPNQYVPEIIALLRANVAAFQLGARMLPGLQGSPVEIPRQTSAATAVWSAESGTITASDPAFGQVNMVPHQLSAMIQMSRRSATLSNPALETLAKQDIAEQFARALDIAIFSGTGANSQPLGIKNQPSVGTYSFSSNTITYEKLVDMMGVVADANALQGSLGWAGAPKIFRAVMKLLASDGRPIFNWDPALSPSGMTFKPTILTYPFAQTTQLPIAATLGELYFGNWNDVLVGEWGNMILETSTQAGASFEKHQMWVKGVMETDVAVRHPESFVVAANISA